MKLAELMEKEGERFSSKIREADSMEVFMAYLARMGVVMTAEEEDRVKGLMVKGTRGEALSDDELDQVAGGGLYKPISNCPNGHTKFVLWFGMGQVGVVDDNCKNCPYVKKSLGPNGWDLVCQNIGNEMIWE
jgi:hypothetical protein